MAKRACPYCAEKIEWQAIRCKHCKAEVKPLPKQGGRTGTIIVCTILASIYLGFVATRAPRGQATSAETSQPEPQQEATQTEEQPTEVAATALAAAYKDNELTGDSQYKNKLLIVSGRVNKVTRILGDVIVIFGREYDVHTVHAWITKSDEQAAATLKTGQRIKVKGKCGGAMAIAGVKIEDATIVEQ